MYVRTGWFYITQRCGDKKGTVWYWIQFGIGPVQCDWLDGWLVVSMDHGAVARRWAAFWLLLQCQVHWQYVPLTECLERFHNECSVILLCFMQWYIDVSLGVAVADSDGMARCLSLKITSTWIYQSYCAIAWFVNLVWKSMSTRMCNSRANNHFRQKCSWQV